MTDSLEKFPVSCGKQRRNTRRRTVEIVADVARRLWPNKVAMHLAGATGASPRAAENWLAGDTGMRADHLVEFLRSEAGRELLAEIMAERPPAWWRAIERQYRLAELDRRAEWNRRAIAALRHRLHCEQSEEERNAAAALTPV